MHLNSFIHLLTKAACSISLPLSERKKQNIGYLAPLQFSSDCIPIFSHLLHFLCKKSDMEIKEKNFQILPVFFVITLTSSLLFVLFKIEIGLVKSSSLEIVSLMESAEILKLREN